MRRQRNEFGHSRSSWGQRDIFAERPRRRFPWIPILLAAAVAAGVYVFSDPRLGSRLQGLWAGSSKPATVPASVPQGGGDDRFTILPLPPEPPGAR